MTHVALSPDSTQLAGSAKGYLFLWDVSTCSALGAPFKLGIHSSSRETFISFSPNGKKLIVSVLGKVEVLDLSKRISLFCGSFLYDLDTKENLDFEFIGPVCFINNECAVACYYNRNGVLICRREVVKGTSIIRNYSLPGILSVCLSPNGKYLGCLITPGKVLIQEISYENNDVRFTFSSIEFEIGHFQSNYDTHFNNNTPNLFEDVTQSDDDTQLELVAHTVILAVSCCGRYVAMGLNREIFKIWDKTSGTFVFKQHFGGTIHSIVMSHPSKGEAKQIGFTVGEDFYTYGLDTGIAYKHDLGTALSRNASGTKVAISPNNLFIAIPGEFGAGLFELLSERTKWAWRGSEGEVEISEVNHRPDKDANEIALMEDGSVVFSSTSSIWTYPRFGRMIKQTLKYDNKRVLSIKLASDGKAVAILTEHNSSSTDKGFKSVEEIELWTRDTPCDDFVLLETRSTDDWEVYSAIEYARGEYNAYVDIHFISDSDARI